MQVDTEDILLLTNFEVWSYLKRLQENKQKVNNQQTLLFTALKYFKDKSACANQSEEQIKKFNESLSIFKLTKIEIKNLIDLMPTSQVELSLIINDLDTRYNAEQIQCILSEVKNQFPEAYAIQQKVLGNNPDDVGQESTN